MKKNFLSAAVLLLTACAETPISEQYQAAVNDAAIVKTNEVSQQLWAITPENPQLVWNDDKTKILVATWKSHESYEKFLKNNTQTNGNIDFALWVTAVPQVKQFCQAFKDEDVNLRLKQYLGLAPDWNYDEFIELWVSPNDLFRPCVDAEINDKQCQAEIPKEFTKTEHGQFYQQLYFKSFRASAGVPWTGLGYTYDWGNNQTKVGASEFIIKPNAPYQIKQVLKTRDYCSK